MGPIPPRADAPFRDVSGILEPASIAVIGASERPGNLGGDTVRRLVKFGFPGPVWPVSRTASSVAGLPGFPAVSGLPGVPHLAVLAVQAEALLDAVRECAAVGVADAKAGDAVKLVCVKKDPNVTEAAVRAYCEANLTGYKRPKIVEFRSAPSAASSAWRRR